MPLSFSNSIYGVRPPVEVYGIEGGQHGVSRDRVDACQIVLFILIIIVAATLGIILCNLLKPGGGERPGACHSMLSDQESDTNSIHVESDQHFTEILQKLPKAIVMFHAEWCGHCRHMKPIVTSVADKTKGVPFVFADGDKLKPDTLGKFGVDGYPTVMSVVDGKVTQYQGERSEEHLAAWCSAV